MYYNNNVLCVVYNNNNNPCLYIYLLTFLWEKGETHSTQHTTDNDVDDDEQITARSWLNVQLTIFYIRAAAIVTTVKCRVISFVLVFYMNMLDKMFKTLRLRLRLLSKTLFYTHIQTYCIHISLLPFFSSYYLAS